MRKSRWRKYFKEYEWWQIWAMLKNNRRDPEICRAPAEGKLVVITGATSGIGYQTARKYAAMGADLFLINRNRDKTNALIGELQKDFQANCQFHIADLSILEEIKGAAQALIRLDRPIEVIIHNAGVYYTRKEITADGLEYMFVVHYLSSFIINLLLLEKLKQQVHARIILINSEGHRFAAWGLKLDDLNFTRQRYSGLKSYGSAKTAQLLSMLIFAWKLKNSKVSIIAMHPGAVKSNTGTENGPLYRWFKKHFFDKTLKPAEISAEAIYFLGVSPKVADITAKFFNLTTEEMPAPPALDFEVAEELWDISLKMAGFETSSP
jgi:NAD(P)-dependent dehydrogenase (short-subunit alcohol dehydrogenase family)